MKLPDFLKFAPLNQLRHSMKAELTEFKIDINIDIINQYTISC